MANDFSKLRAARSNNDDRGKIERNARQVGARAIVKRTRDKQINVRTTDEVHKALVYIARQFESSQIEALEKIILDKAADLRLENSESNS